MTAASSMSTTCRRTPWSACWTWTHVAAEVAEVRAARGGFVSADDLLIACESLDPDRLDLLRDRLIFIPRDRHLLP